MAFWQMAREVVFIETHLLILLHECILLTTKLTLQCRVLVRVMDFSHVESISNIGRMIYT